MEFQERLKKIRENAGFTQTELANAIGVNQKDISRWETGDRAPAMPAIIKLCIALNVSADILLGLKEL